MTVEYGFGMLFVGILAISVASIIIFFVVNRLIKDREWEEGLKKCKNGREIEEFLRKNLPRE
tara:strand:+ start:179 stop:364 length:186 start_codon:yes stop_codon:yes gene_type:complete